MARWWQKLEAGIATVDHPLEREHQVGPAAGKPWPPQHTPEPAPRSGIAAGHEPEDRPRPDDQAVRLYELLALAADAVARFTAGTAERDARAEYAARIEREAEAEPEYALQAQAPDKAEIEM